MSNSDINSKIDSLESEISDMHTKIMDIQRDVHLIQEQLIAADARDQKIIALLEFIKDTSGDGKFIDYNDARPGKFTKPIMNVGNISPKDILRTTSPNGTIRMRTKSPNTTLRGHQQTNSTTNKTPSLRAKSPNSTLRGTHTSLRAKSPNSTIHNGIHSSIRNNGNNKAKISDKQITQITSSLIQGITASKKKTSGVPIKN